MFILVVEDPNAEPELPFIPKNMPQLSDRIKVFGPYPTKRRASDAGRTLPPYRYNWLVTTLNNLSEDLDNPAGALFWGDAPDGA